MLYNTFLSDFYQRRDAIGHILWCFWYQKSHTIFSRIAWKLVQVLDWKREWLYKYIGLNLESR